MQCSWARRSSNVVVALALSMAVAPSHAADTVADTTSETSAAATIDRLHATLADVIARADTLGFAGRLELLAPALTAAFDLPFMAEKSIGAHWRGLSEEDRQRWLKVFAHHSAATYAARLNLDKGQKFERIGEAPGGRDTVAVSTKISTPSEPDVSLTYRLRDGDHGWQVIDLYLDGTISELAIRRSDYAAILRKGGLDALIESLESKSAAFAAGATPE